MESHLNHETKSYDEKQINSVLFTKKQNLKKEKEEYSKMKIIVEDCLESISTYLNDLILFKEEEIKMSKLPKTRQEDELSKIVFKTSNLMLDAEKYYTKNKSGYFKIHSMGKRYFGFCFRHDNLPLSILYPLPKISFK